jgi:hypothetical protein
MCLLIREQWLSSRRPARREEENWGEERLAHHTVLFTPPLIGGVLSFSLLKRRGRSRQGELSLSSLLLKGRNCPLLAEGLSLSLH